MTTLSFRARICAALLLTITALARVATGQCTLTPVPGQPPPGIGGGVSTMVAWDPDGAGPEPTKIYAGGFFQSAGSTLCSNIAAWNGFEWEPLATGVDGPVRAMAVYNGKLYVGGSFNTAGGWNSQNIAAWNGTGWEQISWGMTAPAGWYNEVRAMAVFGTSLYVGGTMATITDWFNTTVTVHGIAGYNSTSGWFPIGNGMSHDTYPQGYVNALAVHGGGLYVGGDFIAANGIFANNIARYNGGGSLNWQALGPGIDHTVGELLPFGGELIVNDGFGELQRWNGASWLTFSSQPGAYYSRVDAIVSHNNELYAGGYFLNFFGGPYSYLKRWTEFGWVDANAQIDGAPYAMCSYGGEIYAGGDFTRCGGVNVSRIAAWNGSTWRRLGPQGGFNDAMYESEVIGDDLYVLGGFSAYGATSMNRLAHWNGSSWSPVGAGFDGPYGASGLASFQGDLVAFGNDELTSGGVQLHGVARWTGSSWDALGNSVLRGSDPGFIRDAVEWNGNLVVGGMFDVIGGVAAQNIALWDGDSWHPLSTGINFFGVDKLIVYRGELIAAGDFTTAGGVSAFDIARWDGAQWHAMGSGLVDDPPSWGNTVEAMVVFMDELYVAGNFGKAGGVPARNVAKWNGTAWSALGPGLGQSSDIVWSLTVYQGSVFASGYFTDASGFQFGGVRRWSGALWGDVLGPMGAAVYTIAAHQGRLFVGGEFGAIKNLFSSYGGHPIAFGAFLECNGTTQNAWGLDTDVSDFEPFNGVMHASERPQSGPADVASFASFIGGFLPVSSPALNGPANAMAAWTPPGSAQQLVVTGLFSQAGPTAVNNIAAWNGSSWSTLSTGLNGTGTALFPFANSLYVSGAFSTAGGSPAAFMARWTGSAWQAVPGFNNFARAFTVYNNELVATGTFTQAGGQNANRIARWNGSSWVPLGTGLAHPSLAQGFALAVYDGDLYVGGTFNSAGGVPSPNIARWDGVQWHDVGGPAGANNGVFALASHNGQLIAGGAFTSIGGVPANRLARWDGVSWSPFGAGTDGTVLTLQPSGCSLYVGGGFSQMNGTVVQNAAVWYDDTLPPFISQPVSVTDLCPKQSVIFTFEHETTCNSFTYSWRRNGTPLSNGTTPAGSVITGANTRTLEISNLHFEDEGQYTCVLIDPSGWFQFPTYPTTLALGCPITNEYCTGAIPITGNGVYTGTNYSSEDLDGASLCDDQLSDKDVWWKFTAPATGTADIDACGSDFEIVLSIHSACPGTTANQVACDGSPNACGDPGVSFFVTQGQTYYVRVAGLLGETGEVRLNVNLPTLANGDDCADPLQIHEGEVALGALFNATSGGASSCGNDATGPDVWYHFFATRDGTLTVDTCGSNNWNGFADTGLDTTLSLWSDCSMNPGAEFACNDNAAGTPCDTGAEAFDSRLSLPMTQGQRVFIRVGQHDDRFRTGLFLLEANFDGPGCDSIDFNNDGVFPATEDVIAFITVLSGGDCPSGWCNDIDFNNDGVYPDLGDVFVLLRVFSGGNCQP